MKSFYIRFKEEPYKDTVVEGQGLLSGLDNNIKTGIIPVGQHIYYHAGTVVEEDVFEEVKEAIIPGKIYKGNNSCVWYCTEEISSGYLFTSSPVGSANRVYWKFNKDGVSEWGNGQYKLILTTKKVSTGKKRVIKVLP